jgi:hypothetical protein
LINNAFSNTTNGDQIQWPTLYSTIENMSLNERKQKQISSSISMQNYNDQIKPCATNNPFRSQVHGRTSSLQQNSSYNNNFYRQTSVTPRILNSSYNDEQHSNQLPSTYFGSGSNVGRGRPMTGDR